MKKLNDKESPLFYYPHYITASQEPKIMRMRVDYKAKGYGYYNFICEFLASRGGIAEYNPKVVAKAISEEPRSVAKFLDDCINLYGIFQSDGSNFWSEELVEHAKIVRGRSEKNSENGKKNTGPRKTNKLRTKELEDFEEREFFSDRLAIAEPEPSECLAVAEQSVSDCPAILKEKEKEKANGIISYSSDRLTEKKPYGQHQNVTLSDAEYETLRTMFGEVELLALITRLSIYKVRNNKDYASDYTTIKLWAQNDQRAKSDTSMMLKPKSEFIPKQAFSIWDEQEAQA